MFVSFLFWIAVLCCAVAQLAILHSVVGSPARVAGSEPTSRARRAAEIAWAVIPGVALAIVLAFTWRAMHAMHAMHAVHAVHAVQIAGASVADVIR